MPLCWLCGTCCRMVRHCAAPQDSRLPRASLVSWHRHIRATGTGSASACFMRESLHSAAKSRMHECHLMQTGLTCWMPCKGDCQPVSITHSTMALDGLRSTQHVSWSEHGQMSCMAFAGENSSSSPYNGLPDRLSAHSAQPAPQPAAGSSMKHTPYLAVASATQNTMSVLWSSRIDNSSASRHRLPCWCPHFEIRA